MKYRRFLGGMIVVLLQAQWTMAEAQISGETQVWHSLILNFEGPEASELDDEPNPFLDYRLQVTFSGPEDRSYNVPGYFDGDGAGGTRGNVWRVRFTPDAAGEWRYRASFRKGEDIAVSLDPDAGSPVVLDGASGVFTVAPRNPEAPGFAKWGLLQYVGGHYLKFRDGPYWIRGGADSPENFLAYAGFDNTPPSHHYAEHEDDWRPGDPDWGGGKGRGIIGALNALAEAHVNSVYMLTMNVGGDGGDVWPFAEIAQRNGSPENDNLHFDLSKLAQWEQVFAHAQRRGIFLHLVLNEAEAPNKKELDDGDLGVERKLYYRELAARFGHHLAMQWNLCEEYNLGFDLGPERVRAFAEYLGAMDPYDHPITVHSAGDPVEKLTFTFGDPRFSMTSIQLNQRPIHEVTEAIWHATEDAGRPLPVSLDEFTLDFGQASHIPRDDADRHRREKIWPTYFSGGMMEFILEGLLDVDDFTTPKRAALWRNVYIARRFMEKHLPFWEMEPGDGLVSGAATIPLGVGDCNTIPLGPQVFSKPRAVYAIYFPSAQQTGSLDLSQTEGAFTLRWFNPRSGEFVGETTQVTGGGSLAVGLPPEDRREDWVCLLERAGGE